MPIRAFTCPSLVRRALRRDVRPQPRPYVCVPCMFGPSLPSSLAARAVSRSPLPLVSFPCLADPARLHVRIVERADDEDVFGD